MPRKTLKERREKNPTDDNSNRIRGVVDNIIGKETPDDLMFELLEAVKDSYTVIPSIGKYYIFNYLAKTPLIQYDQNPLVGVVEIYSWGFKGFNYHWDGMRQYTWEEVQGNFYEIYSYELTDAKKIPFKKIVLNS
jgi:hypothetical protein|tara:strand:+ start:123 stop:527 length:405 start_codon:yes stop_codon:yes gene_type:complete